MTDYAKIENGTIVEIGPEPNSWVNPDGSTTITPVDTPTPAAVLKKLGYLPIEYPELEDGRVVDHYTYKILSTRVQATAVYADVEVISSSDNVSTQLENQNTIINEMTEKFQERAQQMDEHNNWLWERIGDVTDLQNRISVLEQKMTTVTDQLSVLEGSSIVNALADILKRLRALEA